MTNNLPGKIDQLPAKGVGLACYRNNPGFPTYIPFVRLVEIKAKHHHIEEGFIAVKFLKGYLLKSKFFEMAMIWGQAGFGYSTPSLSPELARLLEYMERDPLLRHEILVYFYKYIESKTLQTAPAVPGGDGT